MPNGKSQKPQIVRPSARGAAYRAFHLRLIEELRQRHHFTGVRKVQPRHYCDFAAGKSGTRYSASFAKNHEVRTEVCLRMRHQPQVNKARFAALKKDKTAIEREFGEPLRWERLDKGKWCRIATYRPGSIGDTDTLGEIRAWMINRLLRFKKVFGPRLQRLALTL